MVWQLDNLKDDVPKDQARSAVRLFALDCAKMSTALADIILYKGDMGKGASLGRNVSKSLEFEPALPDSVAELLLFRVCIPPDQQKLLMQGRSEEAGRRGCTASDAEAGRAGAGAREEVAARIQKKARRNAGLFCRGIAAITCRVPAARHRRGASNGDDAPLRLMICACSFAIGRARSAAASPAAVRALHGEPVARADIEVHGRVGRSETSIGGAKSWPVGNVLVKRPEREAIACGDAMPRAPLSVVEKTIFACEVEATVPA